MKTYYTYAEAKIASPEFEVVKSKHTDWFVVKDFGDVNSEWSICNPADHCSTLTDFLEAGYELKSKDSILIGKGIVKYIDSVNDGYYNANDGRNEGSLILSAAALNGGSKIPEQKESTVKDIDWSKMPEGAERYLVSGGDTWWYRSEDGEIYKHFPGASNWVKSDFISRWEEAKPIPTLRETFVKVDMPINDIAKAMIDGEVFYSEDGKKCASWSDGYFCNNYGLQCILTGPFHRKTLTPVDHKQGWIEAAHSLMNGLDGQVDICIEHLAAIYDAGLACKPE